MLVARAIGLLNTITQLLGRQRRSTDEKGKKIKKKGKMVKVVL